MNEELQECLNKVKRLIRERPWTSRDIIEAAVVGLEGFEEKVRAERDERSKWAMLNLLQFTLDSKSFVKLKDKQWIHLIDIMFCLCPHGYKNVSKLEKQALDILAEQCNRLKVISKESVFIMNKGSDVYDWLFEITNYYKENK